MGPYDGDSALDFFKRYSAKINRYLAIEPELKNLVNLRENLKNYSENVSVIEKGLAATSGSFQIQSSGSASSLVTEIDGNIDSQIVEVVTLPAILEAESTIFNLIKTDIEGFDREVIQSVLPYIEKHLPTLAISIYHNPDDLWEIPLDIHSTIGDKYAYYIRQEGHWGLETILYCVPKC